MIITNAQLTGQTTQHISSLSARVGIHHDLHAPWLALQQAAQMAGFELTIASGFRTFERQLTIWNNKFSGATPVFYQHNQPVDFSLLSILEKIHAIMLYSALPGASRHHWGTDIDVYAANLLPAEQTLQLATWEYQLDGPFAQLSEWLQHHASEFGFYFPYDRFRGGIAEEPWHLSYYPLATYFESQLNEVLLYDCLAASNIQGKQTILANLTDIYQRFIINISETPNA